MKHRHSPKPQQSPPQHRPRNNSAIQNVISSVNNATSAVANLSQLNMGQMGGVQMNNFLSHPHDEPMRGLQHSEGRGLGSQEEIDLLSEKHDEYI
jgi:hypothetical protein